MEAVGNEAPSILFIPHWGMEGGAGFYNQDLISDLGAIADVRVGGRYRTHYSGKPIRSKEIDRLGSLSFPIYEGISYRATLWYLVRSLFSIGLLLPGLIGKRPRRIANSEVIILTSSVQALAVPLVRRFFPRGQVIIAVQENLVLTRGFGRVMLWLLRQADGVISISNAWSEHARSVGLGTTLLRNGYAPDYADFEVCGDGDYRSDILYVGGEAAIKGFDNLLRALPALLSRPRMKIICLGRYGDGALAALTSARKDAHPSAQIDVVGQVPDIRPYLAGTSVLLLPLGNAHFCRPAIEAGFFGKSFVISSLPGMGDFVRNGENCLVFEAGNVDDLVATTLRLIGDKELRSTLERGNRLSSEKYLRSPTQVTEIFRKVLSRSSTKKSKDFPKNEFRNED